MKEVGFDLEPDADAAGPYYEAFNDTAPTTPAAAYWNSPTAMVLSIYSTRLEELAPGNNMSWVKNPAIDDVRSRRRRPPPTIEQQTQLYEQVQKHRRRERLHLGLYPQTTRWSRRSTCKDVWIEPSEGEPVLTTRGWRA